MDIDIVKRSAEHYLKTAEGPVSARIAFVRGLSEVQAGLDEDRPYQVPDSDTAREALVTGQQLFLVSAPAVPLDGYREAVRQVAEYVAGSAGLPDDHAEALRSAGLAAAVTDELLATAARGDVTALAAEVSRVVGVAQEGPLTPATVAFVMQAALVPFLAGPSARICQSLGATDWRTWNSGRCPVCGASAAMGRMGEGSVRQGAERTLWCASCHAQWEHDRVRCVRCGTRDPNKLRYTYIEEDPTHRLHLCDDCHGYLRVVFEDEHAGPLSMIVEDAVSTTLDAVARDKGYTPEGDRGASPR